MSSGAVLLIIVTLQRLVELAHAQRNTNRLLARGAQEVGASHYPLIVAVHGVWLGALWFTSWNNQFVALWVVAYAVLQVFRIWILISLGERWTTRIIVLDEPLVAKGPYKFVRHPNYWLVVAEIAVVPLALGQPLLALGFSVANAAVLWVRIKAEDRALRSR